MHAKNGFKIKYDSAYLDVRLKGSGLEKIGEFPLAFSCLRTSKTDKKEPFVNVYLAKIPQGVIVERVYPNCRNEEMESVTNAKIKLQKYCSWKLLECGIEHTFGVRFTDVNFNLNESGKWACDLCEFSISHSSNMVCVAISQKPVGIDVERVQAPKVDISKEILSTGELEVYNALAKDEKVPFLIGAWAKKESLFKIKNKKSLSKEEFKSQNGIVLQAMLLALGEEFALGVATEYPKNVKVFTVDL